jgi:hypothetical protein
LHGSGEFADWNAPPKGLDANNGIYLVKGVVQHGGILKELYALHRLQLVGAVNAQEGALFT